MWRIRPVTVLGTLMVVLLFGAVVAEGGWYWNSLIDVEGTNVSTVWSVVGDNDGADNYTAAIDVVLPERAQFILLSKSGNETVTIGTDSSLDCGNGELEGIVTYNVKPLTDEVGQKVKVTVKADGKPIGRGMGMLGEDISVDISIPAENASCG